MLGSVLGSMCFCPDPGRSCQVFRTRIRIPSKLGTGIRIPAGYQAIAAPSCCFEVGAEDAMHSYDCEVSSDGAACRNLELLQTSPPCRTSILKKPADPVEQPCSIRCSTLHSQPGVAHNSSKILNIKGSITHLPCVAAHSTLSQGPRWPRDRAGIGIRSERYF